MRTGSSPGIVPNARFPLLPTWYEAEFAVPLAVRFTVPEGKSASLHLIDVAKHGLIAPEEEARRTRHLHVSRNE